MAPHLATQSPPLRGHDPHLWEGERERGREGGREGGREREGERERERGERERERGALIKETTTYAYSVSLCVEGTAKDEL